MFAQAREFFLLERAAQQNASLAASPSESVRVYRDAAVARLRASRDLPGRGQTSIALALYREAILLLSLAVLDLERENDRPAQASSALVLDKLLRSLDSSRVPLPASLVRASKLFDEYDPLRLDQMSALQARKAVEDLDALAAWLLDRIEVRLPQDVRARRYRRVGGLFAAVLVVALGFASWRLTPRNLAAHRPVTSSSREFGTKPEGAVDGDKFTRFGFHSASEESPWLAIDLGRRCAMTRVKVYGRGDCCFDQSIPLGVEVSEDGIDYREVAERSEPFSRSMPWIIHLGSVAGRFVRLRTKRVSYLVLSEVEVYGDCAR